jgi:hypothetical protein
MWLWLLQITGDEIVSQARGLHCKVRQWPGQVNVIDGQVCGVGIWLGQFLPVTRGLRPEAHQGGVGARKL